MDAQPLGTPLWDFSIAVYGGDGVEGECLDLQERYGLDVNVLLLAAYAGVVEGVRLTAADFAAANATVAGWQADVVRPLRQARRGLKGKNAETLRSQVKASETEAEKTEQVLLWQWSRRHLAASAPGDRADALAANLRVVLDYVGAAGAALLHLQKAASAYRR